MTRQIRFNAFDMDCVAHQASGMWRHPLDRSRDYNKLSHWTELAKLLGKGRFDGIFIADVLGTYDVYRDSNEAPIKHGAQVPSKYDALDARHVAAASLPLPQEKLRRPRLNGRSPPSPPGAWSLPATP